MSLESLLHNGGPAVGALLIGWAAAHFGIQAPLAASALVAVVAWLALSPRVVRRSAHLEGRVEAQADAQERSQAQAAQ
jgi:hypothetical protein